MKEKYLTGRWELSCLVINLILYKIFTNVPESFMEAGSSAFMATVISALISYAVIWFLPCIYKKAGAKNIFELLEKNRLATVFCGLIILTWLILSSAQALESLVSFSKIAAFPSAPFVFIACFFLLAAAAAVLKGMEAAVRPHALIVPFCIFMILFMLSSVVKYFDLTNLLPVFGKGVKETLYTSVKNLPCFFDFVLVFLINPFIKNEESLCRTVRISGAVGIAVVLLIMLSANLIISYPVSEQIEFPVFQIMKNVYFGRFFQRIDAVYLLSAVLSGMAYLSFTVFLMTYTFKKTFRTENNRPFVWNFLLIIMLLALLIYKKHAMLYIPLTFFGVSAVILLISVPLILPEGRAKK